MWPRPRAVTLASEPMFTMLHAPSGLLAHAEASQHQIPPAALNILEGDLFGNTHDSFTRDIAKKINTTKGRVELAVELSDPERIAHVAGDGNPAASQSPHGGGCLLGTIEIEIHEQRVRTSLAQGEGHGASDTLGRPSDKGYFPFEIEEV